MDLQAAEKIFSADRMWRYMAAHPNDEAKALLHYQCNVEISEAFYPCLSTLEVALRNAVNRELTTLFGVPDWYAQFPTTAGLAG